MENKIIELMKKVKKEREKERKDMNKEMPIGITYICLKIEHGQE